MPPPLLDIYNFYTLGIFPHCWFPVSLDQFFLKTLYFLMSSLPIYNYCNIYFTELYFDYLNIETSSEHCHNFKI